MRMMRPLPRVPSGTRRGVGGVCSRSSCRAGLSPSVRASALALPLLSDDEPPMLIFAQRVIDRSWGPRTIRSKSRWTCRRGAPKGWRSRSAAAPGVGQLYAGDRRGLWFALAEVAGWTAPCSIAIRARACATTRRATPARRDSSSAWSYERWTAATQSDPAELQRPLCGRSRGVLRSDRLGPALRGRLGGLERGAGSLQALRELPTTATATTLHRCRLWVNHWRRRWTACARHGSQCFRSRPTWDFR